MFMRRKILPEALLVTNREKRLNRILKTLQDPVLDPILSTTALKRTKINRRKTLSLSHSKALNTSFTFVLKCRRCTPMITLQQERQGGHLL